jgi:ferredoxin-NADP reductase
MNALTTLLGELLTPRTVSGALDALVPAGFRQGRIVGIEHPTPDSAAFTIRAPFGQPAHRPGQWVPIEVEIDGVRNRRSYSLTSLPGHRHLRITVAAGPDGLVSRHLVHQAEVGDLVHVGPPEGDFTLDSSAGALLFLTGGSGITPALGMLRALAAAPAGATRDVVVVHHAPSAATMIHGADLEAMAAEHDWLTVILVETQAGDGARLDAARLEQFCPDWRERNAYVCGPASLVGWALDHWDAANLLDRFHMESFTPLPPRHRATDGSTVSCTRSDITVNAAAGPTLLDAVETAGLRPATGCRTGICHTCSTRLVAGSVVDVRDGRRKTAPTAVQICVNTADGDIQLDL